jgi:predicted DNA-binding protein (MmcQ/YjbR family)
MQTEFIAAYMHRKAGVTEETPFGPEALVYKVVGKMFALVAWQEDPPRITLKCDPELAITLRSHYPAVQPGYYMNKKHWNTITLDGSIPDDEITGMIDASYGLVTRGLSKADRQKLYPQG